MRILVTGGCGFIGSNFVKHALSQKTVERVANIDMQTYAGQGNNLQHMGLIPDKRYHLYKMNLSDYKLVAQAVAKERPAVIVNFAAESHVDRSIAAPSDFIQTNVVGTFSLLESARNNGLELFIQVSTDEVYGSLRSYSPKSRETDMTCPRSPYSSSKDAAERVALAYFHTYDLPVMIIRSSNNYGSFQFPEKIIPLFITNLLDGKKVPLMYSRENPASNRRDWLHVEDNCRAIWHLIHRGRTGEIYNIGGEQELTNMRLTEILLSQFGIGQEMIEFIPHRKGHDFRYALDTDKLRSTGFEILPRDFKQDMADLIEWYKENESWWRPLKRKNGKSHKKNS